MNKIKTFLAASFFAFNCGRTGLEYGDSSNIDAYTVDVNGSDASVVDNNHSSSVCPISPSVWPTDNVQAIIVNNTEDLRGTPHQDVIIDIMSPVILETDFQRPSGAHGAVLYLDSAPQRTMVWYGHAVGLYRLETLAQQRCGYLYRIYIGFSDIGCELRTCRSFNVGDRMRIMVTACSPTSGDCTTGIESDVIGFSWN